jgi:hypothetical protein
MGPGLAMVFEADEEPCPASVKHLFGDERTPLCVGIGCMLELFEQGRDPGGTDLGLNGLGTCPLHLVPETR